jgi:purine-nucleoside phosphorylase
MSANLFDRLEAAAAAVRHRCETAPASAIVLGSGLGDVVNLLADPTVLAYRDLPYWPVTSVEGHRSQLVIGKVAGRIVAVLAGRVHRYEGRSFDDITFAARVMGRLGVRQVILTNAAGGLHPALAPGTLMVIDDHINLMDGNPLTGANDERLGPRFPDMTAVYSARLRASAHETAREHGVPLASGVYAAVCGPGYETPAEVRYLRAIGADAVGMSLVPEAIAARHMGMEILGLACVTNAARSQAAGLSLAAPPQPPMTHDEVLAVASSMSARLATIVHGVVAGT